MNLKEQRAEKMTALVELKDAIEANDPDAIAKGEEIRAAIEAIDASIEQAEKAQELLETIGTETTEPEEEAPAMGNAKTIGQFAAKSLDLAGLKSGVIARTGSAWGKAATDPTTAPTVTITDTNVVDVRPQQLRIRDLFATEAINGNSLSYFVMGAMEGTMGTVAENGKKPQVHFPYTQTPATLQKVAAWWYETDELLEDADFLASAIDGRGEYMFDKAVESYLATTLLAVSGIQTISTGVNLDNILTAKNNVLAQTGYAADGVVLNPTDLTTLMLTKDDNLQYLFGGPAFGPYGNGNYSNVVTMWGMPVVASDAVAAGTAIVGAFGVGASVVTKANGGQRVEVFREDGENVQYNRVTVRIEERLALATRIPAAFVKITA